MSQVQDIADLLSTMIENNRSNDFRVACEVIETAFGYGECVEILERVKAKMGEREDVCLEPLYEKESFYTDMTKENNGYPF